MTTINRKYPLTNSCLFRLSNKRKLAAILDVDVNILRNKRYTELIRYSVFENEKKRTIYSPHHMLKTIQKKLLRYFARIETPEYLMSGKKGISYIDNARIHVENYYIVTADITGFYSNCKRNDVHKMLIDKFEMSRDIADIITDIVCYENFIPTGSPTSQMIAYFTYSDTFDYIKSIAEIDGCKFTLYVDDMTFSAKENIKRNLLYKVNTELLKRGLRLKPSKTKMYFKNNNSVITGVAKDKYGNMKVPNKLRLSIIDCYKQYKKETSDHQKALYLKIRGKLQAARTIENNIFSSFKI